MSPSLRCSRRCAIPKPGSSAKARVMAVSWAWAKGSMIEGREHAKKVLAARAGTVQKEEPFGLQVFDCWYAL